MEFTLFGPVYFLSGDSHPGDSYAEDELKRRLRPSFTSWTGQAEIYDPTPLPMHDFPRRAAHLENYLAAQKAHGSTILMGRSSGARLATWYASRHLVAAVLCIGYPFRNQSRGDEPDRYRHLAGLRAPTLICQGLEDAYGGSNIFKDYALSPAVRVHLLKADHNFIMSQDTWDAVARIMLEFCQETLRRA